MFSDFKHHRNVSTGYGIRKPIGFLIGVADGCFLTVFLFLFYLSTFDHAKAAVSGRNLGTIIGSAIPDLLLSDTGNRHLC